MIILTALSILITILAAFSVLFAILCKTRADDTFFSLAILFCVLSVVIFYVYTTLGFTPI